MTRAADARVEAWAPTRELCLAEAVRGTVAAFVDTSAARMASVRRVRLVGSCSDDYLLVTVLDEVIHLAVTAGEVPVDLEVTPLHDGVEVLFGMADVRELPQLGVVPIGVSPRKLRFGSGPPGWSSSRESPCYVGPYAMACNEGGPGRPGTLDLLDRCRDHSVTSSHLADQRPTSRGDTNL